jgi:hypothetical protein
MCSETLRRSKHRRLSTSRQSVDRLITDKRLDAIVICAGRRKRLVRISDVALKKFLGIWKGWDYSE